MFCKYMDDFTVTLTSPIYFNGTWHTQLPETLDFTAGYEVAVMDMIYKTGSWDNVRAGKNTIQLHREYIEVAKVYNIIKEEILLYLEQQASDEIVYEIPVGRYNDKMDLLTAIQVTLRQPKTVDGFGFVFAKSTMNRYGQITYPDFDGNSPRWKYTGKSHDAAVEDSVTKIKFCREIAQLLGLLARFGAKPQWIQGGDMGLLKDVDVNRNNAGILWILGDFIKPVFVGNNRAPVLHILTTSLEEGVTHEQAINRYYHEVMRFSTRSLGITITHELNQPLNFYNSFVLTLHFHKINVS